MLKALAALRVEPVAHTSLGYAPWNHHVSRSKHRQRTLHGRSLRGNFLPEEPPLRDSLERILSLWVRTEMPQDRQFNLLHLYFS
ncbi:MAG TPA: hypothetical protein VHI52_18950, partial [Verrucomicrobiae bacterium]|nr:hypothetical protein [Verrucomicrobiae bacterium]